MSCKNMVIYTDIECNKIGPSRHSMRMTLTPSVLSGLPDFSARESCWLPKILLVFLPPVLGGKIPQYDWFREAPELRLEGP